MDGHDDSESDLSAEIRKLGKNLKDSLQTAWESEERKKIQQEIESGVAEISAMLKKATDEFDARQVEEEIKEGVETLQRRMRDGELESQVREELLKALRTINAELNTLMEKWARAADQDSNTET